MSIFHLTLRNQLTGKFQTHFMIPHIKIITLKDHQLTVIFKAKNTLQSNVNYNDILDDKSH